MVPIFNNFKRIQPQLINLKMIGNQNKVKLYILKANNIEMIFLYWSYQKFLLLQRKKKDLEYHLRNFTKKDTPCPALQNKIIKNHSFKLQKLKTQSNLFLYVDI